MPRILFITTSFENGAIPNILLDLAPHWRSSGWECLFLALEPLPEDQASVRRCRALGFPLESLEVGPRSVVRAMIRLRTSIRRLAPDLISTHLGRADIFTPWVKGSVPQVTTHHNILEHHGFMTKWGYRLSDSLVALRTGVSADCNRSFVGPGFLKTPHVVIHNPVAVDRLIVGKDRRQVLADGGWADPVKLLVAVARLTEQKGYPVLLEALAELRNRGRTDLRLAIAGEGPLRPFLETRVRDLGLQDVVQFLGMVTEVGNLYASADGLVLPSLWEGLGLVILEAWALGCPVAATRLPAIQEFLVDGENGLLFAPGDVSAAAAAIERLLSDPEAARRWAAAGRSLVSERFSPTVIALEYERVFRQVLREVAHP